jgi:hypothetical protein
VQVRTHLADARRRTDELFTLLAPEAMYDRPIPERHRIVFYLGHLEAFDWNQICRGSLGIASFHPAFDKLFEFGIDPPLGSLPQDQPADWPSVDEVRRYNARVREQIDRALERGSIPDQIWRVAIEHRLMHAETLAYMWHNLPPERKIAPPGIALDDAEPGPAAMIEVPAGDAILGRKRGDGFGWDNEFEEHAVSVPGFNMQSRKVTNGDYLEFVRQGADPPHFWTRHGAGWLQRTMFGAVPLPLSWPVYATQQQAAAYAAWKGKQLPSEAQFHRAGNGAAPENCNFERWDPVPAAGPAAEISQLVGNGWEWTSTVFAPFPGFEPFPFYPGYSANFFDGKHYVLKGASPRTAACFLRPSFRNWFRPEYPYVYAGFRLVEN